LRPDRQKDTSTDNNVTVNDNRKFLAWIKQPKLLQSSRERIQKI